MVMANVSVLVAVYNASAYLDKCLDSLLAQTFTDFQVICIDDASTDKSLSILRDYAQRDRRIEVISLAENHGQAYARNQGLQRATGDFICMLDADDWFSPDALECAVDCFSKPDVDVVLFDLQLCWPRYSRPYAMPQFKTLSGEEAFQLSLTWQIHGLYMVRAEIHHRHPYDTTCRLYSDDNTTRLHYISARRVVVCNGIYYYRQHASSATHQVSVRQFDYLIANASMKAQLLKLDVSREVLALYENHRWLNLVGVWMFYYVHGRELTKQERRYGLQHLHEAWKSIDRRLLSRSTVCKFGYCPMPTWSLFRLQEWLYFSLRDILGKNNSKI